VALRGVECTGFGGMVAKVKEVSLIPEKELPDWLGPKISVFDSKVRT